MGRDSDQSDQTANPFSIPLYYDIPLAIGDCIRNLRSALDYLPSSMARAAGLPDNNTIFPFSEKRAGIEASFTEAEIGDKHRKRRRAGALYNLSRQYPKLKHIILDRIKPYSVDDGADDFGGFLWRIITSDNVDKHRLMTPTIQKFSDFNITATDGARLVGTGSFTGSFVRFAPGSKLQKDSHFAVDIVFKEPARLAGKPVTATLVKACEDVTKVIDIFDATFSIAD